MPTHRRLGVYIIISLLSYSLLQATFTPTLYDNGYTRTLAYWLRKTQPIGVLPKSIQELILSYTVNPYLPNPNLIASFRFPDAQNQFFHIMLHHHHKLLLYNQKKGQLHIFCPENSQESRIIRIQTDEQPYRIRCMNAFYTQKKNIIVIGGKQPGCCFIPSFNDFLIVFTKGEYSRGGNLLSQDSELELLQLNTTSSSQGVDDIAFSQKGSIIIASSYNTIVVFREQHNPFAYVKIGVYLPPSHVSLEIVPGTLCVDKFNNLFFMEFARQGMYVSYISLTQLEGIMLSQDKSLYIQDFIETTECFDIDNIYLVFMNNIASQFFFIPYPMTTMHTKQSSYVMNNFKFKMKPLEEGCLILNTIEKSARRSNIRRINTDGKWEDSLTIDASVYPECLFLIQDDNQNHNKLLLFTDKYSKKPWHTICVNTQKKKAIYSERPFSHNPKLSKCWATSLLQLSSLLCLAVLENEEIGGALLYLYG